MAVLEVVDQVAERHPGPDEDRRTAKNFRIALDDLGMLTHRQIAIPASRAFLHLPLTLSRKRAAQQSAVAAPPTRLPPYDAFCTATAGRVLRISDPTVGSSATSQTSPRRGRATAVNEPATSPHPPPPTPR